MACGRARQCRKFTSFLCYQTTSRACAKDDPLQTFREGKASPDDTVTLFFADDRGDTLAGGPLSKNVFHFTVPQGAVSKGQDGKSLLLAVHRNHFYLNSVDAVNVRIVS